MKVAAVAASTAAAAASAATANTKRKVTGKKIRWKKLTLTVLIIFTFAKCAESLFYCGRDRIIFHLLCVWLCEFVCMRTSKYAQPKICQHLKII